MRTHDFQTFFALIPQFRRGGGPIFGTKFDAPRLGRELKAPTLGIWLFVLLIALMRKTDFEFPSGKKKGCSAPRMCVSMHTSKFKQDASVCVRTFPNDPKRNALRANNRE